jgi:hypothetical protein
MLRLGAVLGVLVLMGCGQGQTQQTQSSQKVAEAICLQDLSTYLDCMVSYTDNVQQGNAIRYAEDQQRREQRNTLWLAFAKGMADAAANHYKAQADFYEERRTRYNTHIINGQMINCTTYSNGNMNCY